MRLDPPKALQRKRSGTAYNSRWFELDSTHRQQQFETEADLFFSCDMDARHSSRPGADWHSLDLAGKCNRRRLHPTGSAKAVCNQGKEPQRKRKLTLRRTSRVLGAPPWSHARTETLNFPRTPSTPPHHRKLGLPGKDGVDGKGEALAGAVAASARRSSAGGGRGT